MVTRKPLPENASVDAKLQSQLRMKATRQEQWSREESEASADQAWRDESDQRETGTSADVPAALRPGGAPPTFSNIEQERNVWKEDPSAEQQEDVARIPAILKPGGAHSHADDPAVADLAADVSRVPTILIPGGVSGKPETNPFKRQMTGASTGSASGIDTREQSGVPLFSPSAIPLPPSASLSQLNLNEQSNNPWQPALLRKESLATPSRNSLDQEGGSDVWSSAGHARQPSPLPAPTSPALLSLASEEEIPGWEEESKKESVQLSPPQPPDENVFQDTHAWDDLGNVGKGKAPALPVTLPTSGLNAVADDWNLIDAEPLPGPPPKSSRQDTGEHWEDVEEKRPPVPERAAVDSASALPPRTSSVAVPPPPRAVSTSETYQIKNINWIDATAAKNPRTSPILVQNANGPCPLVALVNALTLTTPSELSTAMVEVLRSREQVSLNLLLDAVFDELMSSRRTNEDGALPDVTELYAFLQGLHTGMNVNPRFIPTPEVIAAFKRTSLTHVHPTERGNLIPGTFENTKEMTLYSTFSIPLIHGWLPEMGEPAYDAFARNAVSYEDAQNLLFREEELEEKLSSPSHQGLTPEEQQMYQDILTIKSFLSISATQLTVWGLEVITKAMRPGSVAILFRNDHFSTLYRHPQTLQLFTLVTDAGYAGHAEVVWESLVDVSGENAEFFSGDFRLVGGAGHAEGGDAQIPGGYPSSSRNGSDWHGGEDDNSNGWTTVQGRNQRNQKQAERSGDVPLSPKHEQEDRDLALALQLQEEEEERHRAEQARRQRESQLSEQFIEQQARGPGSGPGSGQQSQGGRGGASIRGGRSGSRASTPVVVPGRRSSSSVSIPVTTTNGGPVRGRGGAASPVAPRGRATVQSVRSLIPPRSDGVNRATDENADDAPPSYEQAAKESPYVPPEGHPSHPTSRSDRRGSSSTSASTSAPPSGLLRQGPPTVSRTTSGMSGAPGRMRPGVPPAAMAGNGSSTGRDKDCVVM